MHEIKVIATYGNIRHKITKMWWNLSGTILSRTHFHVIALIHKLFCNK